MEAASDDVVADFTEILNRRVSLGNLVDLGVSGIVESCGAGRTMGHVGSRLFGFLDSQSGICSESILLEMLALRLGINLLDPESVIEALRV